ncbi:MAG TPA: ribonuclease H-like YkuK family protein [Candidatus Bathyarchaeia archaeon]|nr:ribonuclease H-like YkuK family protein [Candidatus Bathyarchaeia archaeon]
MRKNGFFISPSVGKLTINKMVSELVDFINEEPSDFYRLVVGTDSKSKRAKKDYQLDLITAVVIHRKGKGGRYFWQRNKKKKAHSLRDKIYTETLYSLDLAEILVPLLQKCLNGEPYELEIHIDVGQNGPTREMIKEVVGMVNGNGFTAKTKPESYGAFVVADKHT